MKYINRIFLQQYLRKFEKANPDDILIGTKFYFRNMRYAYETKRNYEQYIIITGK